MSRFPKLTETFVLDEILELEARNVRVEVFPLWREPAKVLHPGARAVVDRAHFLPTLDGSILWDNLTTLIEQPGRYLATLFTLIVANSGSPRFLAGALAIFPKSVAFARRMKQLGVEHVHAHFASHPAAAAFTVGRLSDLSWSFTAHGSDLHREQAMLREKVAEAKFTIAISEYNKRFILERAQNENTDQIKVVHCGVDPTVFVREARPEGACRPKDPPFEIVCVGTLHAVKGQRHLIHAAAHLSELDLDWKLHLVGEGEDRSALTALASELGVGHRIEFHGALDREGVRSVLRRADVCVAPSVPTSDGRREGIPVVLMEAAATGLPLVASRLSGIPELVEDGKTGLLVEPGDENGLAEALLRLAAEPRLRQELGRAAQELVEKEFCLKRNVDCLESLFFGDAP
jgi:glycosyltransferase involved in cell wall biosynthesis